MGETSTPRARGPAALLPAWVARLAGFAALALLGALQWQRLVGGLDAGRAVVWVLVAVAAALAVLWADSRRRYRGVLTLAAAAAGLLAAYVASGLELRLLRPRHWPELADGLAGGVEVLGRVELPYAAADRWPALTLQLLGALLCVLAALLAFWPREGGRGYRFLALATLLVLVASPLVSLGGARQVAIGGVLAALTVCFLWLERLPLRPGVGVAALLALALAGALPLASVADGDQPWFDYRSFAEGLGPDEPIRFDWNHSYGPISWPREGTEVLRIAAEKASYWKVRELDEFDGEVWRDSGPQSGRGDPALDLVPDFRDRPGWMQTFEVSVRRLRSTDIVTAGTALDVRDSSTPVRSAGRPGRWRAESEMRRGDSYTVEAHVPRPTANQLTRSKTADRGRQYEYLAVTVPFAGAGAAAGEGGGPTGLPTTPDGTPVRAAVVQFPPFGAITLGFQPRAEYPTIERSGDGRYALRNSTYERTWRLAQRLRRDVETPYEYVRAVDAYLHDGFAYAERPAAIDPGRSVLDGFLLDTKSGYCQHFSGAMALLLRMGGVPARVATGFSPGGYSERKDAWVVRDTDAHSWVEVWFDSWGWVTFDPTPESTPARSQIAALEEAPDPTEESGDDEGAGGGSGTRPDSGVRGDLLQDSLRDSEGGSAGDAGRSGWWWALVPVALLAAAAAWGWRRHAGLRLGQERLLAELEAALRRAGRPAPLGTTLSQLEARLGGTPEAAAYLRALRAGRYAPTATAPPTAAQRRALRRELATGLGATGRVRALWALPPWRG